MPAKTGFSSFFDNFLDSAGKIYITQQELKQRQVQLKQAEKQLEIQAASAKDRMKQTQLDQFKQNWTMAQQEYTRRHPSEPTAKETAELEYKKQQTKTSAAQEKLYGARAGTVVKGEEEKKLSLDDIVKTYRKDFFTQDAQDWFDQTEQAAQKGDWNTFIKLGDQISQLQIMLEQGISGTSESTKSQISSARAFWGTVYRNLAPEGYTPPAAPTVRAMGAGTSTIPEDEASEISDAFDSDDSATLQRFIDQYGSEAVERVIAGTE